MLEVTSVVVTGKVADVAPAGTLTELATFALASEDLRETTAPPVGAGPFNVTVPVTVLLLPETTDGVDSDNWVSANGISTIVVDSVDLPRVAVRVAFVLEDTAVVETANVAELAPAAI